jgi:hypothetical protein
MAVDNKQLICPSRGRLRMGAKVLRPRQRDVVISPASRRDGNNTVARQASEPGGYKDLACKEGTVTSDCGFTLAGSNR